MLLSHNSIQRVGDDSLSTFDPPRHHHLSALGHDIAQRSSGVLLHLSILAIEQAHERRDGAVLHQSHLHLRVEGQVANRRDGVLQHHSLA